MTEVTGPGPAEMRALAVKLRAADPKLRRGLLREFRVAGAPIVRAVQQSIRDMPSHHGAAAGGTGLREATARTVFASAGVTKAGARLDIVSSGRRMPEGEGNLPKYLDEARGWSHPVFARGPRFTLGRSKAKRYRRRPAFLTPLVKRGAWTWVHQEGKPQWFEEPIGRRATDVRHACERAMEAVKRDLDRAGPA